MKVYFTIAAIFIGVFLNAQTKIASKAVAKSKLLVNAIFESKDKSTLEKLFAAEMIYQNSDGKTEAREQAIKDISENKTTYTQANMTKGFGVSKSADSTVVKYFFKGKEHKPDGVTSVYTVNVSMIWFKQKKDIKLARLEMLRIE
ncbi:MAG: nuclear transport factor 2 family protein [Bacteroidetes bacterium]|nr:nuclear transport factor 2 family protein [Bacteroidota bacterium]